MCWCACVSHACVCVCVCVTCVCVHAYLYTLECLSTHVCNCMHGWVCDINTHGNSFFILDNRCYCNGHASRGTIIGAVAITGARVSSLGTPFRSHGTVSLLIGYSPRAVRVCYHNDTIQIIRCYDCVSQTTLMINSKYTAVLNILNIFI